MIIIIIISKTNFGLFFLKCNPFLPEQFPPGIIVLRSAIIPSIRTSIVVALGLFASYDGVGHDFSRGCHAPTVPFFFVTLNPEVSPVCFAPGHVRILCRGRIDRFDRLIHPTGLLFWKRKKNREIGRWNISNSVNIKCTIKLLPSGNLPSHTYFWVCHHVYKKLILKHNKKIKKIKLFTYLFFFKNF